MSSIANYEQGRNPNCPMLYVLAKEAMAAGREDLVEFFCSELDEQLTSKYNATSTAETQTTTATLARVRKEACA